MTKRVLMATLGVLTAGTLALAAGLVCWLLLGEVGMEPVEIAKGCAFGWVGYVAALGVERLIERWHRG